MPRHCVLGASLGLFDETDETALAFFETGNDGLLWELGEVFVLYDVVMKIIA